MRINMNPTHSVSGSSSKPAEHVNPDPLCSFLAQIDAIQNSQDEGDRRGDADSRDDGPDESGGLPLFSGLVPTGTPDQLPHSLNPAANQLSGSSAKGEALPVGRCFAALIEAEAQDSSEPDSGTSISAPLAVLVGSKAGVEPAAKDGKPVHGAPSFPFVSEDRQDWPGEAASARSAQIRQATTGISGAVAAENMDEQNRLSQSVSTGLARALERATDLSSPAAYARMDGENPRALSNGIAQTIERNPEVSGTPAVAERDERNPLLQLFSNGVAPVLENRSATPAGKDAVSDSWTRSQPAPQKRSAAELPQPEPVIADSAVHRLSSDFATSGAPEQSGNARDPFGTGSLATQKFNSAVSQNEEGIGSQTGDRSGPDESSCASITHGKSNAAEPEILMARAGMDGSRQENLAHLFPTSAPLVDSNIRTGPNAAPEPARPQNLVLQIADRIQIQIRDGGGEIRVQLKPDGLGRLEIKAETTANGVIARISTDSDGVKNYLEGNLHQLQQTLQDQGLKVDRIYVTVQNGSEAGSSHTAQFGHSGQGQQGRAPQDPQYDTRADERAMAEEITVDPATWLLLKPDTKFHTIA